VETLASRMMKVKNIGTRNEAYVTNCIGRRAALLDEEKTLDEAAIDRYAFIRDAYLQHRQSMVYDGNPPREKYDDEEDDDGKPDKSSSSNSGKSASPAPAETSPVAISVVNEKLSTESPVATHIDPAAPQPPPTVVRVWLSQGE